MAKDLGPPSMFTAAERIVGGALAAAQSVHKGDHHAAFSAVLKRAGDDRALAGAIIFLHLAYALEAVNRAEAKPN